MSPGLRCRSAEGHKALFAPLAANAGHARPELEIREIEGDQFSDAETCRVEKLHSRPVSATRPGVGKPVQKLLDGITIGDLGRAFDVMRMRHRICRARVDGALGDQKPEVGAEGGKGPTD